MPKVIAYIRVSTDEQAVNGYGLEAQLHAIRAFAAAKLEGLEFVEARPDEGISGAAPPDERPGLIHALSLVGDGDVFLVAKRDRMARDVYTAAWIDKEVRRLGGRVMSAADEGSNGSPDDIGGLVIRTITDLFAEIERRMIAARTKAALAAKARRREALGNVPMGYQRGPVLDPSRPSVRMLEANEGEQASLARLRELAALDPRPTFGQIARKLNSENLNARGGPWSRGTVRRVINRLAKETT